MPRRSDDWLAETAERIEAAAADLVADRGFDGFSMRELLDEASLSVGCFYTHFQDKEAVLRAVGCWHAGNHRRRLGDLVGSDPVPVQLRNLVRGAVTEFARPRRGIHGRLEVHSWSELLTNPDRVVPYAQDLSTLVATVQRILREGQRRGEIDRHVFAPTGGMAVASLILMLPLLRALGYCFTPARMGAVVERMVRSLEPEPPRRRSG